MFSQFLQIIKDGKSDLKLIFFFCFIDIIDIKKISNETSCLTVKSCAGDVTQRATVSMDTLQELVKWQSNGAHSLQLFIKQEQTAFEIFLRHPSYFK